MSKRTDPNRPSQFLALLCLLTLLLAGCSSPPTTAVAPPASTPAAETDAYWPTEDWRTSLPEIQGMDAQKLARMLVVIEQRRLNLHSLLIIRNGYLVSESYFGLYQPGTRHELYSCTKSFVATLIGIALDKGYIAGMDQRIVEFFPDRTFADVDAQKAAMTLEDTLTMRTGLDWREEDSTFRALYISSDWVKYVLDEPMAAAPGTKFNYCSGCSHVLSAVLQQTTGTNPRDFADRYLFKPLGISNVEWETDAEGTPIGGWGLQLTPRDMTKLGYLYLRHGQWAGQQIVSAKWVEVATRTHAETDGNLDYGYQWWTYPSLTAYAALGRYGQMILVVPKLDLVVVTTADMDNHDEIFRLVEQYILPAVQESH